jgi:hypothetical protein
MANCHHSSFEAAHKMGSRMWLCLVLFSMMATIEVQAQLPTYRAETGEVQFRSEAPLEIIEAKSKALRGAINPNENTFAFTIEINSFDGFNSALQRVHFNENYLESPTYPRATFSGKIIEKIDWNQEGQHEIRAKGLLNIHGQEKERIIRSELEIRPNELYVKSAFSLMLADHNITIPKIVSQKIAEEIFIDIELSFSIFPSK